MGVLGDGSGWCFCSGGAKLERMKSTILAAKGAAVAAVSFPGGGKGGGKGGSGFLIHRGLLLTTHGTTPSAAAVGAAEVRLTTAASQPAWCLKRESLAVAMHHEKIQLL